MVKYRSEMFFLKIGDGLYIGSDGQWLHNQKIDIIRRSHQLAAICTKMIYKTGKKEYNIQERNIYIHLAANIDILKHLIKIHVIVNGSCSLS